MSALEKALLSQDEARSLTDEVKGDAERLWRKLVELYEGGAHEVLGYRSWGVYFETEFGGSDATAYRLLQSGRALAQLPIGSPRPRNEAQARELTPLLNQPEELADAWHEVIELHPDPTAANVREVVQSRMGEPPHAFVGIEVDRLKDLARAACRRGDIGEQPFGSCPTKAALVRLDDALGRRAA